MLSSVLNDQGGGRLACAAAICLAECQKLVSVSYLCVACPGDRESQLSGHDVSP